MLRTAFIGGVLVAGGCAGTDASDTMGALSLASVGEGSSGVTTVSDSGTSTSAASGSQTSTSAGPTSAGTTTGATTTDGSTGAPMNCGNGVIDPMEDCDGTNLAGQDCVSSGFEQGTLACAMDCTLDTSGCFVSEFLQNDNGACTQALGCISGGPVTVVECYTSTLTPPLLVSEIHYQFMDFGSFTLPASASAVVYAWPGLGSPPGAQLGAEPLDPATQINTAPQMFTLATPIMVPTASFCVGLTTPQSMGLARSPTETVPGTSYDLAPNPPCNVSPFTEIANLSNPVPGEMCLRARVLGAAP